MKIKKIVFLFFCFGSLFFSCGSQVEFLREEGWGEEEEPDVQEKTSACLERIVGGKTICVEQKVKTFYVEDLGKKSVDFLFVVDVSLSMLEDLSRLGQAFSDLMSQISISDWQIFFTTADHGDYEKDPVTGQDVMILSVQENWKDYTGSAPRFGYFMDLEYQGKRLNQKSLDAKTPDYVNVFKDTLTKTPQEDCSHAPYCQGSLEQPLRVLNSSLERLAQEVTSSSLPSLRESADFISFLVTDEDERVEDPDNATSAEKVVENFKNWFPEKSFHSFALLIQDEECLNLQKKHSPNSVYGKRVAKLAELTHGKNISICEEKYGPPLQEISQLLRNLIESLKLDHEPILPEEVKVEFIKGKNQTDWTINGNKIVFPSALEEGSEIKVSYFVEKK